MDSEMPSYTASKIEAFEPDRDRERRRDLGRNKRARFSLKPNSSQPTVNLAPQPDIKKLRDPEEFFSAYEKHKNAKRELQKQTGAVLSDWDLNNISMNERPCRQGTLGRRPVKYTHHTYGHISSQENHEEKILVSFNASPVKENAVTNVESEEFEESELDEGPVAVAENRVNKLLDDLLAENDEQLDGDGAVTLLQERLQIKPIHLDKLSLPDFQNIHSIDLNASRGHLAKSRNFLLGLSSKTQYCQAASSVHYVPSSLPSKSSLSTLSLLRKRALQSDQLSDPFSMDTIDRVTAMNASTSKKVNKMSDHAEPQIALRMPTQFESAVAEENMAEITAVSFDAERGDGAGRSEDFANDYPNGLDSVVNLGLGESGAGDKHNVGISINDNKQNDQVGTGKEVLNITHQLESAITEEDTIEVAAERFEAETINFSGSSHNLIKDGQIGIGSVNLGLSGPNAGNEDVRVSSDVTKQFSKAEAEKEVLGMFHQLESPVVEENISAVATANSEGLSSSQGQLNNRGSNVDKAGSSQRILDESSDVGIAAAVNQAMEGSSEVTGSVSELAQEKVSKSSSLSVNKQSSTHLCKEQKKKNPARRQSLAGLGTLVSENGLRRSTRVRSRPLEYWKGEKFLYGRIHESLATVIGIKYESPGKAGEQPMLKVKSFVSDEKVFAKTARFWR